MAGEDEVFLNKSSRFFIGAFLSSLLSLILTSLSDFLASLSLLPSLSEASSAILFLSHSLTPVNLSPASPPRPLDPTSPFSSWYFFISSSEVKATFRDLGFPTGQATPFRAILVSLAWSLLSNFTQQVDLILSIQKSWMAPVLFNISFKALTVKGLVRLVMRRKLVSFTSSVKVILFFFLTGSSLLIAVGTFGPATSGSDSMLFVSPSSCSMMGSLLSMRGAMSG